MKLFSITNGCCLLVRIIKVLGKNSAPFAYVAHATLMSIPMTMWMLVTQGLADLPGRNNF